MKVNIHDAKTNLSQLLALVEQGEIVIIARHGKPVAQLVPVRTQGLPFGIAIKDALVPPGDKWWQPMSDEEGTAWIDE